MLMFAEKQSKYNASFVTLLLCIFAAINNSGDYNRCTGSTWWSSVLVEAPGYE